MRKDWVCRLNLTRTDRHVYYTTGLHKDEILDVCQMIRTELTADERTWPPILGLYLSVVVTLGYLRRNRVQAELAETYGVSQSTISRAVSALTPVLARLLRPFVPTAEELDLQKHYIVDGTLLPCWSWAGHPELYSGKHKTTGLNVQVASAPSRDRAFFPHSRRPACMDLRPSRRQPPRHPLPA